MLKQSKVAREGGEEGGNGELLDSSCAKHLVQNNLHCSRVDDSRKRVGGKKNFKCLSCQKPNNECTKGCSQGHNRSRHSKSGFFSAVTILLLKTLRKKIAQKSLNMLI